MLPLQYQIKTITNMNRDYITYKGVNYPIVNIELSKISDVESDELVTIAGLSLWDNIEDEYDKGNKVANEIDNDIYVYVWYDIDLENCTEEELIKYINNYC